MARRRSKRPKGFKSKAQWRMFFARGKKSVKWRKWAHEKAHSTAGGPRTRFRRLPNRKGGPSKRSVW